MAELGTALQAPEQRAELETAGLEPKEEVALQQGASGRVLVAPMGR